MKTSVRKAGGDQRIGQMTDFLVGQWGRPMTDLVRELAQKWPTLTRAELHAALERAGKEVGRLAREGEIGGVGPPPPPVSDFLGWSFDGLGTLFSAAALVSLVHHGFHVGLIPTLQACLRYYQDTVHPIMGWLLSWPRVVFHRWAPPDWLKDLYSLSFVGGFGAARGLTNLFIENGGFTSEANASPNPYMYMGVPPGARMFGTILLGVPLALTMAGLLFLATAPLNMTVVLIKFRCRNDPQWRSWVRKLCMPVVGALCGCAVFFALNAALQ